jgi:hypothetical protein
MPMKVRLVTLCRVAQLTQDGVANAVGIVDFFWNAAFPATFAIDVLVGFEADAGEAGQSLAATIEMVDADAVPLCRAHVLVEPGAPGPSGDRWVRYVAFPLAFTSPQPGEHELRVTCAGELIASLSVSVIRRSM